DRHTQRTAPSYPPVSFPSFIIYLNIYKSINTCINTFLFFFLLFFFTDFVCVCLLVQCPEATLTQFQCLRQTDRQTHREGRARCRPSTRARGHVEGTLGF